MQFDIEEWTPEKVLFTAKAWKVLDEDLQRFVGYCLEKLWDKMSEPDEVSYELISAHLDTNVWGPLPRFVVKWKRQTCDEEFRDIQKTELFHFWFSPAEFALGVKSYFPKFLCEFKTNNALEEKRAKEAAFYEYKKLKERWGFE